MRFSIRWLSFELFATYITYSSMGVWNVPTSGSRSLRAVIQAQ